MADLAPAPMLMIAEPRADYALLDSGDGRKWERYGDYTFIRPEPQAMWAPSGEWEWEAHSEFVPASDEDGGGRWVDALPVPSEGWPLDWEGVAFTARCTPFRHLGYFPDMDPVWRWLREGLAEASDPKALNLFGYTGVGTLAMAQTGASLVHVDASKKSVQAARDNAALAGMTDVPVRWLIDDAAKFAAREVRRGRRYDAILLDPPKYGRGPDGERWELERDLPGLVESVAGLLDGDSKRLFLTVYAVRMSAVALAELFAEKLTHLGGTIEYGDLCVREEARGKLLPTAIFARWSP